MGGGWFGRRGHCEAAAGRQTCRDSKGTGLQMNLSTVRLRG